MKAGERYVLSRMGIVSALGRGAAETAARAKAGDTSGMVPVEGLSGGGTNALFPVPDGGRRELDACAVALRLGTH